MTGRWPDPEVDHENHNRTDNRWLNLKEVSDRDNDTNRSLYINNTSGRVGVCWYKRTNKWHAKIKVNDHLISLGYFNKFEDACSARKVAEKKYNFHVNHGQ
jgi:hypothetical protein